MCFRQPRIPADQDALSRLGTVMYDEGRSRVFHPHPPRCANIFNRLVVFMVPRDCAWQGPRTVCRGTGWRGCGDTSARGSTPIGRFAYSAHHVPPCAPCFLTWWYQRSWGRRVRVGATAYNTPSGEAFFFYRFDVCTPLLTFEGLPFSARRLVSDSEVKAFDDMMQEAAKKHLGLDVSLAGMSAPLIRS